jgi:hypothetical protein
LHLSGAELYDTYEVYHEDFRPVGDGVITVYSAGSALKKYQKYYPEHAFLLMPGVKYDE